MRLRDKVIVVAPGTFGLGFEAAKLFVAQGAQLILTGTDPDTGEQACKQLLEAGAQATYVKVNPRREKDFESLVQHAIATFGRIDGAFGCPDHIRRADLTKTSAKSFDHTINYNARSLFFLVKYVGPVIESGGGGAIVLLSSVYAKISGVNAVAYEVSKGMALSLARSFGTYYAQRNVRVNSILHGHHLNSANDLKPEHAGLCPPTAKQAERIASCYPSKRVAQGSEIAQAALFLLSDEASFCNGSELVVDGGLSTR